MTRQVTLNLLVAVRKQHTELLAGCLISIKLVLEGIHLSTEVTCQGVPSGFLFAGSIRLQLSITDALTGQAISSGGCRAGNAAAVP